MSPSQQSQATLNRPAGLVRRPTLPSWVISLLLHMVLLAVLGVTFRLAPPRGAAAERTAEVGIVLKRQDGGEQFFQGEDEAGRGDSQAAATGGGLEELLSDQPPSDPRSELPSSFDLIGPGSLEGGGVGTAIGAEKGPPGGGQGIGGRFRTTVFGIEGEGYKIVYVFDRSVSMGWRNALAAAKAQLLASLESLEKTHQFQIIFYNEEPKPAPIGQPGKLVFATEQNKAMARKFVGSIIASGGTDHERPLVLAVKLQPDVIFFLTDADDPRLSAGQLEKIRRMAAGITIHAIEFGSGPQPRSDSFLARLARDNAGKHAYVDISRPIR